jgi:phosphomannomutase
MRNPALGLVGDLLLIRHGQTPCVIVNRFCGTHESVLTPEGERMAGYLAGHPSLDGIDRLISSPQRRAMQTARAIAASRPVEVEVERRVREASFGVWENRLPAEFDEADIQAHRRWEYDPALYSPPGGESGLEVMARAVAAVRDLLRDGGKVAIVSHKAPIRLIICFFLGLSPSRYRDIGNVSTGSVSGLRFTGRRAVLTALGDVSHLPLAWRAAPDTLRPDPEPAAREQAGGDPLLAGARRWIAGDIDPADQDELSGLADAHAAGDAAAGDELRDRMSEPLAFGTGGMRGPRRAGPNGMNRAVVVSTTAGLATWLRDRGLGGGVVVVGRDARHGSEAFFTDAAGVLSAAGFAVRCLPEPLPTPLVAFAVRELGAVAGIQITASHNHADDNGYKVYLDGGAQLYAPADAEITEAIRGTGPPRTIGRDAYWAQAGDDLVRRYVESTAVVPRGDHRELRIAATPLHGVGGETLLAALSRNGFADVTLVPEQAAPDPDFPTARYPNPEEKGSPALLLKLAESIGADLAIALDPDADRCAAGACAGSGEWRMLSGDELGWLLGDYILAGLDDSARGSAVAASSLVSSSMLRSIAQSRGVCHEETLVGFKWLVRAGEAAGRTLVYAYEEALGYFVNPAVRDKDGISAAVLAADLAADLRRAGRTVFDALDDLAVRHGVHLTDQVAIRCSGARLTELMAQLRAAPPSLLPDDAAEVTDMQPRINLVKLAGQGWRVLFRPSGTELKLKAYIEVVSPVADGAALAGARLAARQRLDALRSGVVAWIG